jgi:hypothetical protein
VEEDEEAQCVPGVDVIGGVMISTGAVHTTWVPFISASSSSQPPSTIPSSLVSRPRVSYRQDGQSDMDDGAIQGTYRPAAVHCHGRYLLRLAVRHVSSMPATIVMTLTIH